MLVIRWGLNSDKSHEVSRQVDIETFFWKKRIGSCVGVIFFTIRATVHVHCSCIIRRALHGISCLYLPPKVMSKTHEGHFITLIKNWLHFIECIPDYTCSSRSSQWRFYSLEILTFSRVCFASFPVSREGSLGTRLGYGPLTRINMSLAYQLKVDFFSTLAFC